MEKLIYCFPEFFVFCAEDSCIVQKTKLGNKSDCITSDRWFLCAKTTKATTLAYALLIQIGKNTFHLV